MEPHNPKGKGAGATSKAAETSLDSVDDRKYQDDDLLDVSNDIPRRAKRTSSATKGPTKDDDLLLMSDDDTGGFAPLRDEDGPQSQPDEVLNRTATDMESQPIIFLGHNRSSGLEKPVTQPPSREQSENHILYPQDAPQDLNMSMSFKPTDPLDHMLGTQASLDASLMMMMDVDEPDETRNNMEIVAQTQNPDDMMIVDVPQPQRRPAAAPIIIESPSPSLGDHLLQLADETLGPAGASKPAEDASGQPGQPGQNRRLPLWMVAEKDHQEELQQRLHEKITHTRQIKKHTSRMAEAAQDDHEAAASSTGKAWKDELIPENIGAGRVICFDVETTGFSQRDCIIEIGAIEMIGGFRTGVMYQSYVKPKVPINPFAAAVHGLTNERLEKAPPVEIVLPAFLAWIGTSPLVAHNAAFDLRMLFQECERMGLQAFLQNRPVFCTMKYYRSLFPQRPYALIDVYLNLRDKQDIQTVRLKTMFRTRAARFGR
jgi:DNA polymerase III epsilon subunit family exonuclease